MSALLGALVLFAIGLLGSRFSFTTAGSSLAARVPLIAGSHYLLVGLLLAAPPIRLLTPEVLQSLYPLFALAIGWVGLLFGLQLDLRALRRFPGHLVALALLQALFAFAVFLLLGYGLLRIPGPLDRDLQAALGAAAATACISSPLAVVLVTRLMNVQGRFAELLLFVASLDGLVGIVALQVVYALYNPLDLGLEDYFRAGLEWVPVALALGIALGIMFLWLTRPKPGLQELTVFLLGLSLFAAGSALHMGISALFVAVTAGILIGNLSPLRGRIFEVLQSWEKTIYVVLLVLMGALLDFASWITIPVALAYTLLRLVSKLAGGWAAARIVPAAERPPAAFALGLTAQSGMTVALVLSLVLSYGALRETQPPLVHLLVTSIITAVILSEIIGPLLTRELLRRTDGGRSASGAVGERIHA